VITISEKEVEESHRREITEDLKKKDNKEIKSTGLILSGIGGILFLIEIMFILTYMADIILLLMIAGIISLIGTGIGVKKIKIGGIIILISIPFSIITVALLNQWVIPQIAGNIASLLLPTPFPNSVVLIFGGILCLISSDE
jgi:hypothetical protein